MPRTTRGEFHYETLSILAEDGSVDEALLPALSAAQLKKMFEDMVMLRLFDERGIAMQRQGRIGTFAPSFGQEAVQIGAAAALKPTDWAAPSFREQGVYLARGIKPSTLFLFFMGTEEGNRWPRKFHMLPYCIPCATQILHAVGIGMAAKIKKDPVGVMAFFGDGATSEGDFHEGLNFAGVYQTPNVFLCQNNEWAISTPRARQTRTQTLAEKAIAYGIPGMQVDGNDILAVYAAADEALQRGRSWQGPTFLECLTYRMGVHTTADDPSRYREDAEVLAWKPKDPLDRFERYLLKTGVLQKGEREAVTAALSERLKREAAEAEEICRNLSPDEMFTYLYAEMPEFLREQMTAHFKEAKEGPTDGIAHG